MAKRGKKTKTTKRKSASKSIKKGSLMKILEAVVLIGAVAGVLIRFFKGGKKKNKK